MKSTTNYSFSKVPQADIPRSNFNRSFGHKSTFNAGDLVPIFCDEALPGDTFNIKPTMFARMATPIYPIMDNLFLDIHWFSVPYRQLWANFRKFCGEQVDPSDSTDYTIPVRSISSQVNAATFEDYIGLPVDQGPVDYNELYFRAYRHIYNEWYRDQNLIDSETVSTGDSGTGSTTGATLLKRGKRHDYFTSCLPWLQKGDAVTLPLGSEADIIGTADPIQFYDPTNDEYRYLQSGGSGNAVVTGSASTSSNFKFSKLDGDIIDPIKVDLSNATAATINELRQAFQIQKLLERDARSGTRYSEIVKSHFGVDFLDVTYRPEYLGGGTTSVNMHSVAATSENAANLGDLGAFGTALLDSGGFVKSFTEHCIVMGIVSVRADLTYQQGLARQFSRLTRYDHYWPALAHIGEQAVLNKEIYHQGDGATNDDNVFGYQERWAEYRYKQSMITGTFRSNHASTLDAWHLSQEFGSLPSLNETFITETPPIDRVVQTPSEPDFIFDSYFNFQCARPMPVYSVPGLIDHF